MVVLCLFSCLFSCTNRATLDSVILPPDSAVNDADRFAVIVETYISLKDSPGANGIIVNHARRKEIYEVTGTQFVSKDSESELWVHLTDGWLQRSFVELYPSRAKAETAAARLK
ncbi:hypothetical protein HGH47_11330 [Treponema sp. OMZ 805]